MRMKVDIFVSAIFFLNFLFVRSLLIIVVVEEVGESCRVCGSVDVLDWCLIHILFDSRKI